MLLLLLFKGLENFATLLVVDSTYTSRLPSRKLPCGCALLSEERDMPGAVAWPVTSPRLPVMASSASLKERYSRDVSSV